MFGLESLDRIALTIANSVKHFPDEQKQRLLIYLQMRNYPLF